MLCVSVCVCGVGVQRVCAHASVGPSAHERSEARGPAWIPQAYTASCIPQAYTREHGGFIAGTSAVRISRGGSGGGARIARSRLHRLDCGLGRFASHPRSPDELHPFSAKLPQEGAHP